jgi:AAA+ ATPase superfamily predicted ATPase
MKFYDRIDELEILKKADSLKAKHSIFTMVIGRRRVGKTALVLQKISNDPVLYFFVSKKDEALLCEEFTQEIEDKLGVEIFGEIKSFEELFLYLLKVAKTKKFTLIIDEFQEFYKINSSIYSSMQKFWDLHKQSSNLHLIVCGSIYHLMKKIFEDIKEPLFGRVDFKIDLKPLHVEVLKEILEDHLTYSSRNLLDFYTITGGVAKYIELFVLYNSFSREEMINEVFKLNSIFLEEGRVRLVEEFGKEYGTYFSILSLIASSKTSKSEIESILNKNISGYLNRLEVDYSIIKSIKPIGTKPNSKVQKYEIVDNFLAFWFRFIYKYQSLVELENFEKLKYIVNRDWNTYSGEFLEKLYIELINKQKKYNKIGSYWERGNKNEIDIVAIDDIDKELLICEVKLNPKRLNYNELVLKSKKLLEIYKNYKVEYKLLSLESLHEYI